MQPARIHGRAASLLIHWSVLTPLTHLPDFSSNANFTELLLVRGASEIVSLTRRSL